MILNQYDGCDIELRDLEFNTGVPLTDGTLIAVPGHDLFRLYRHGCDFAIVEWIQSSGEYSEDLWADPDVQVQLIAHGHFYWREDGIRHVWFGHDGYINYPNIPAITAALSAAAAIYDEPAEPARVEPAPDPYAALIAAGNGMVHEARNALLPVRMGSAEPNQAIERVLAAVDALNRELRKFDNSSLGACARS